MNTRWNIQIIRYFLDDPIANICRPHLHHDYSAKQTIKQKAARMCKCVVVCMMNMFVPIQRSENVQYRRCNTCQYFYASHSMHVCVCVCGSVLVESKRSTEWVDNRIILPFKVIKWVEGSQYLPNHCSSLYLAKSIINPEMSARSKTTHHQSIKIDVLSTKFDTRYEMLQDISLITFNNLIMLSTILLSNIERHFYFTFCVVLVGGGALFLRSMSFISMTSFTAEHVLGWYALCYRRQTATVCFVYSSSVSSSLPLSLSLFSQYQSFSLYRSK